MLNERQLESNPYLKARGESQLRAKHAFERRAGVYFGFILGISILLLAYVFDGAQLLLVHAEFWWIHFVLALLTIFPLALLAGLISGYSNWLLKIIVWGIFGFVSGWLAMQIPFGGAQFILKFFDPNFSTIDFLTMPGGASDSVGLLTTLGTLLGVLIGVIELVVVNGAWERSTDENQFTIGSWLMLLIVLPFALALAFLFDGTANNPVRTPMQLMQTIITSGLNDLTGLDTKQMDIQRVGIYMAGQKWRAQLTPNYTMRLAAIEPTVPGESFIDTTFANGFNLRCRITAFGEFAGACIDLNTTYRNYVSQFINKGTFDCTDCQGEIAAPAAKWQKQNARPLTPSDTLSVQHGSGSIVLVRVQTQNNAGFECMLSGVNPVVLQECN